MKPNTITLGELRQQLTDLLTMPDDTEITFGQGDLTWYRLKNRGPIAGPALIQFEFNEPYTLIATTPD